MASDNRGGKSKVASILVAVFGSFWTWLYTYEKDAWKFWVGLGLNILGGIFFAYPEFTLSPIFSWILGLGIWLWAIIDVAVKKDEWYSSYTRK